MLPDQPATNKQPGAPTPFRVLTHLLTTPERVALQIAEARRVHPTFPEEGAGLLVFLFLHSAGMRTPYSFGVADQVGHLLNDGWRAVPSGTLAPNPGDIWVVMRDGTPVDAGFVAGLGGSDGTSFLCVDGACESGEARRRMVRGGEEPTIDLWLSYRGQ